MSEESEQVKARTMRFALDVCALIKKLPRDEPGRTVKRQLARSSTGVAFNYRASCRARSHKEFTSKIGVVAEEADESQGWLEFIEAAKLVYDSSLKRLVIESTELTKIASASYGTARAKEREERRKRRAAAPPRGQWTPTTQLPDYPITQLPDLAAPSYPVG